MALFYGKELKQRLEETGILEDVCMVSRSIYEELRVLWQEVAQRIGRASGALKQALDRGVELNPEAMDIAIMIAEDEVRRQEYTGPIRELLETIYTGGSGSVGGLGFLSHICGFQSEAKFLITRKEMDEGIEEALRLIMEATDFAERYGEASIDGVVGMIDELNSAINDVASDILKGKQVFNMADIEARADSAKEALRRFIYDAWTFIGAL